MNAKLKLTLGQIAAPGFDAALHKLRRQPLGKDAYAVGKSIRIIEGELQDYREAYSSIVMKYGKQTSPGNWVIDRGDPGYAQANKELADLQAQTFELFLDHKIRLPDCGPLQEAVSATAAKLMAPFSGTAQPDILNAARLLAEIVNEFRALALTPDEAMLLEPLIEA